MNTGFVRHGIVAAGLLLLADAASVHAFPRRELLPEKAVAVVEISHGPEMIRAFGRTPLARLWNDPQIQQFLGKPDLTKALRETVLDGNEKDAEIAGIMWETVRMLVGETLVAIPAMPGDESGPELYLVARMTEKDFLRSLDLDRRLAELMTDKRLTIRRHTFQDVDLIQHIEERTDKPDAKPRKTWQAFLADTLVYGPSRDWVEQCLVRLKRRKPTEPAGPEPSLTLRMNLPALLTEAIEKEKRNRQGLPPEIAQMLPSMKNVFSALGLMTIGELTMTTAFHADRTETTLRLPVSDFSKGLFTLLDTRPSSPSLRATFIPVNAYGYGVSRMNLTALVRQLPVIVKEAVPALGAQVDMGMGVVDMFLGISLERDLLSHMDTQTIAFSTVMNGQDTDVLAIRLQNEPHVKNALARVFAEGSQVRTQLAAVFNEEEFLDAKLYLFNTPATETDFAPPGTQQLPPPVYALTVESGFLLFGNAPGVRHAVRALHSASPDTAFYQAPLARRMSGAIPPQAFQYSVTNYEEMLKAVVNPRLYGQFRKWVEEAVREALADSEANAWTRLLAQVDFSRWPPLAHIASFLGASLDSAWRDGNTLHMKTVHYHENRP